MQASEEQRADAWRDYCRALAELGAVEELEREHARRILEVPKPDLPDLLYRLGREVQLARQRGDMAAAAQKAREFELNYRRFDRKPSGPVDARGPPAALLDAPALLFLQQGQPEAALEYYAGLYKSVAAVGFMVEETMGLNPRLVHAAALKQTGHKAEAEKNLRAYLVEIEAWEPGEARGLIPFAIYALLGETDAAIAAFRQAVESYQVSAWWALQDGAVDPDYARVLADPRFRSALSELEQSIAAQREDFLANPDLPLEQRMAAGLLNTQ
jgi:hypothetical protein